MPIPTNNSGSPVNGQHTVELNVARIGSDVDDDEVILEEDMGDDCEVILEEVVATPVALYSRFSANHCFTPEATPADHRLLNELHQEIVKLLQDKDHRNYQGVTLYLGSGTFTYTGADGKVESRCFDAVPDADQELATRLHALTKLADKIYPYKINARKANFAHNEKWVKHGMMPLERGTDLLKEIPHNAATLAIATHFLNVLETTVAPEHRLNALINFARMDRMSTPSWTHLEQLITKAEEDLKEEEKKSQPSPNIRQMRAHVRALHGIRQAVSMDQFAMLWALAHRDESKTARAQAEAATTSLNRAMEAFAETRDLENASGIKKFFNKVGLATIEKHPPKFLEKSFAFDVGSLLTPRRKDHFDRSQEHCQPLSGWGSTEYFFTQFVEFIRALEAAAPADKATVVDSLGAVLEETVSESIQGRGLELTPEIQGALRADIAAKVQSYKALEASIDTAGFTAGAFKDLPSLQAGLNTFNTQVNPAALTT